MDGKNQEFSQAELAKLLRKPETKALLDRLRQMDSNALKQAVQQAMQGNTEQARQLLSPMMADPEVQNLAQQMRDDYGRV